MQRYSDPITRNVVSWQQAAERPELAQLSAIEEGWSVYRQPTADDAAINRQRWEQGNPDIAGTASTDNILKKIGETMANSPGEFDGGLS